MSLIDEALKRARQEAARQDEARREERYRQVPVYTPPISVGRRGAGRAWIGAAVVVCILAGVGIGVLLGRGGEEPPSPVALAAPEAPGPEAPDETPAGPVAILEEAPAPPAPVRPPRIEPEEPRAAPEPTPGSVREPRVQPPAEEPLPEEVLPEEVLPEEAPPSPSTPAPPPVQPAPPAPEPAVQAAEEIRTFVREVPVPGGGTIRLNGIAFSAAHPVVLLDSKVLGKGESYQGFTVTDVQPNRVELTGHGMTVAVTLK